jgi:hypothetical protein
MERRLGKAIALLDELYATYAGLIGGDQFVDIKGDYGLMTDYWKKGYTDPQRLELYERLLWRLYEVAANLKIKSRIDGSTLLTLASHRLERARFDGSFASIKNRLENDVSSLALIELEPEHKREQKKAELYDGHCRYMNDLFDHIYTSYLWSGAQRQFFEEILHLPTIDTSDQQLLVSAITLSMMNVFDIQKFLVLTTVYAQSADELVRQRALVGWAFCVDDKKATLYGEMKDVVAELMGDERCRQELTELQMQLVYCMQADDDSQKIKNEIMPDLMKGSNMQMTRRGLVELEESSLDNASYFGRIFARCGGLADAVKEGLKEQGLEDFDLRAISCDGIEECKIALLKKSKNMSDVNFIEGMACVGGCIGGAGCLTHTIKDRAQVDAYGRQAKDKTILGAVEAFDEVDHE